MLNRVSAMRRCACLLIALAVSSSALTVDLDGTSEVREAATVARLSEGQVALVVRGATGGGRREPLLKIVGSDDSYISLYYHRKSEKVTLESSEGGETKSVWWEVRRPHASTLVLVISSRGVLLHAGCKKLHQHSAPARRDLIKFLSHHSIKLYHEEDAPFEVYSTEEAALDALGCETHKKINKEVGGEEESDMLEVSDFANKEKEMLDARNKREDRDEPINVDEYVNNYIAEHQHETHRGDQPSRGFESCDEALIRELIRLRQTIDGLRKDIADQNREIEALRQKQDHCCRATQPPPPPRCSSGSCYPGY